LRRWSNDKREQVFSEPPDRAVRMALDHEREQPSRWAAIISMATTVDKQCRRRGRRGVFDALFQLPAETRMTARLVRMFDSIWCVLMLPPLGQKRGSKILPSAARGADFYGLPIAFHLTGGGVGDSTKSRHLPTSALTPCRVPR